MNDCRRICLTPMRNESWILKQFLAAAHCWATDIIVADQSSTDGTLEQLQNAPNVHVVFNTSANYDEGHRQRLLINRARQIVGKRILLALDADEMLSANCAKSEEWKRIAEAAPGTVLRFRWVNILPGFRQAWIPPNRITCGFIDDGSEHQPARIHSRRIPWPEGAPVIDMEEVVVLHFQYVAWERMASKQRWYQAWEHAVNHKLTPLEIYRGYHHMARGWNDTELFPLHPEWLDGYDRAGIDFRSLKSEPITWWDWEILELLRQHGTDYFSKLNIWDKDWRDLAVTLGLNGVNLLDPRSFGEKTAHRLLAASQNHRSNWGVRAFERLLRWRGW